MHEIRRTELAEQDVLEIWERIAIGGGHPRNAAAFIHQIESAIARCSESPLSGRPRDDLLAGLRTKPVGNYLVCYRPIPEGIELLRVLHGSRDLPRQFK